METNKNKQSRIKRQTLWRAFNSVIAVVALSLTLTATVVVPDTLNRRAYNSEISQLIMDEGIRYEVYKDSLGKATIGVGHLMLSTDDFKKLTPEQVIHILKDDYSLAVNHVRQTYTWADKDVQLVLTNMVYQLGPKGVSKFTGMLAALERGHYEQAAIEMMDSKWARQTPLRSQRLTGRILELDNNWW
jgi:lysozyme